MENHGERLKRMAGISVKNYLKKFRDASEDSVLTNLGFLLLDFMRLHIGIEDEFDIEMSESEIVTFCAIKQSINLIESCS